MSTAPIVFRAGRKRPHPEHTHSRVKLSRHLRATNVPAKVDWCTRIADWPMFRNDALGDCTEAMVGHIIQNTSTYGTGETVTITDDDVLKAYERVSGYTPSDPSTDRGAVLQDVYGDWRKVGVGGHRVLAFAQVDIGNTSEVRQAVYEFGSVGLGIVVSSTMMDDFNAGKPWTRTGGEELGGHAVPVIGFDPDGVDVVTWARVQRMTWDLFAEVVEEGWVGIMSEWFGAGGLDPVGVDLYGLGQELADITGQPNPFPQSGPTPAPSPATSEGLLAELATLVRVVAADTKRDAAELVGWLHRHGL